MEAKVVNMEGVVETVGTKTLLVMGKESETEIPVTIRIRGKEPILTNDWPLGTRVIVTVKVLE